MLARKLLGAWSAGALCRWQAKPGLQGMRWDTVLAVCLPRVAGHAEPMWSSCHFTTLCRLLHKQLHAWSFEGVTGPAPPAWEAS